jgi:hypothetical protein
MGLKPRWWSLHLSRSRALELLAWEEGSGVDRNTPSNSDLGGQYAEFLCNFRDDLGHAA